MNVCEFLTHLEGVTASSDGHQALCPAHSEKHPSLSVGEGEDGRVLVHCHAGCSIDEILKAVSLDEKDLFSGNNGHAGPKKRPIPNQQQAQANPRTIRERAIVGAQEALDDRWRRMLRSQRMLSDETINIYRLGVFNRYSGPRLGIPVFDESGATVDVRLWLHPELRTRGAAKVLPWAKGYGQARVYPIDQLKGDTLVLAAGELDALAAISVGIPTVTATCGEGTWSDELSRPFGDKTVVILMDHDDTGQRGAAKRAESLLRHGARVKVAQWPNARPEGWDITDELREHGVESLQAVIDSAEDQTPAAPAAVQQPRLVKQFALELPETVWRGPVEDYRRMLRETTEASDAYHYFAFMACVGSLVGRRVFLRYGLKLYGNVFICIVGPTGLGRKSTSLRYAERVIRAVDPTWRLLRGLSSAEGLLAQIADPWEKTNQKGQVTETGGTNDKRIMVWLSELSSLLKKAKQDKVSNIIPVLADAFDCPPQLHLPTKADPITVTKPGLSLLSASTPSWLEDMQDRDVMGGFANRFLYILGENKEAIPFPQPPDSHLESKVVQALKDTTTWLDGCHGDEEGEVGLDLSEGSRALWEEYYRRWHSMPWTDDIQSAVLQRIPDIVLKLAVIQAAMEQSRYISPEILQAAIDAGGYAAASAQRIFSEFHVGREAKLEAKILTVLEAGPLKRRDLHQAVGGKYAARDLNQTLEALTRSGQIENAADSRKPQLWKLVQEEAETGEEQRGGA